MSVFFKGRAAELERLAALACEPVAVIYGLPGIGKTELAFQAVGALCAHPEWSEVPMTRVIVDPTKAGNVVGYLLARISGHGSEHPFERLVDVLARERHLVTVDDAHVAAAEIAALVDALGRRDAVASRLLVTARSELPIETTPIVVRLGPLAPSDARTLALHLAERLGVHLERIEEVVARSAGSPFVLRHLISGDWAAAGTDPVEAAVAGLDSEARRSLVRIASVSACSQSRLAASALVDETVLQGLKERFLVDCGPDRIVVHGLVRDVVMHHADARLVLESRRAAAGALWEQFEQRHAPLSAVESICLSASMGDIDEALGRVVAASRRISSAGLDLLLLPIVERLAITGHVEATLLVARIYLRMARIEEAARILDALGAATDDVRVLVLRASIAERVCDLPAASTAFTTAISRTPAGRLRCLLGMRLAVVQTLAGNDEVAAGLLRTVELECHTMSDIDVARLWWVRAIGHTLHQDWTQALGAIETGRAAAVRAGARDLDYLLLLLELLAASEQGDVARSRTVASQVEDALPSHTVRERITDLFLGVSHLACGRVAAAIASLRRAYAELGRRRDTLLSLLAGHYLGRAYLIGGDASAASEVLDAVAQRAAACGLAPLVEPGRVVLARALVSSGRVTEARDVARSVVASHNPLVAAEAEAVLAYVAAFGGDVVEARRHLVRGFEHARGREPLRSNLFLDEAQLEMLGGDPDRVRSAAQAILGDEVRRARPYARGRALIALATANLATGDVDAALEQLAEAELVAGEHGMSHLRERVQLIRSATAIARGSSFDHVPVEQRAGFLGMLRLLGLRHETIVVSGHGARIHVEPSRLGEISSAYDLLIEASTGALVGRSGQRVEGRGTSAAIMVALAESTEPLSAERLYQAVWGGPEYHPLRHRNTLYISLNRTRKLLREVGEQREVIHRDTEGWSISPEIDVAVARRDPRVASTNTRIHPTYAGKDDVKTS